jgi:uncharacterized SAM-binding protein YcdF (DUF218 family)
VGRLIRTIVRAAALLAAAFVCACLLVVAVGIQDRPGHADLIVVPGNLVHGDGSMSLRLESRCTRALQAWRDGLAPRLFVSGGVTPDGRDEAATMRRWFLARGVPDSALVVDRLGSNSWHTARNARRWLDAHGAHGVVIVTQGFHVPRMRLACARSGIAPIFWLHSHFFEREDFYSIAREIPGLAFYAVRPANEDGP